MALPLAQEHASEPLANFVFTDHSGQRQTCVPFGYGKQKNIQPPFDGPLHELEPLTENEKKEKKILKATEFVIFNKLFSFSKLSEILKHLKLTK